MKLKCILFSNIIHKLQSQIKQWRKKQSGIDSTVIHLKLEIARKIIKLKSKNKRIAIPSK